MRILQAKRALLATGLVLAACGFGDPAMLPVQCAVLPGPAEGAVPVGSGDSLGIVLHIDSISRAGEVLVRVDGLSEVGALRFETRPPPTAGAVSLASTTAGVFQGCFGEAPAGFVLRTPRAPRDKVWIRVSSDRPVIVRVETGEPGPQAIRISQPLVVEAGSSGRAAWTGGRP